MGVLVPAAAHVPGGEDDGRATAEVHAVDLRRADGVDLGLALVGAQVDGRVLVEGAEDGVVQLQPVEAAAWEQGLDLGAEGVGELAPAAAGVADDGAAVE